MLSQNKTTKLLFLILISFIIIISGCQSNNQPRQEAKVRSTMQNKSQTNKFKTPDISQKSALESEDSTTTTKVTKKIIKEVNLRIITKDLASISQTVRGIIETYDGYLANSNQWENNRKYSRFTLKIPQENFQKAVNDLEALGEISSKQISSQDITRKYIDLQSRLKNFTAQEERYLELLNQAKDVEDILKVEKELNRVRRKIEQIQGQLNYYNNKVNYSTINLTFTEPKPIINNNSWGVINSLKQSIQEFINSINAIIIISGALLPWLILTTLLAFIIYKLYAWYQKK